jgi:penicillin-binding protein 1A
MKSKIRIFIVFLLTLGSATMALISAVFWFALRDLPEIDSLKNYHPPQSTLVYDRHGALVGRLFDERRTVISLASLPRYVPLAFVAAEDGDFFEHQGIDYFGLLRAVVLEVKFRTVGGRRVGGSTITQQTARAMLLTSKQTYVRKIKEIVLAKRIEDALSKEQILSLYLNQIYFGNGAYGIEEAALTYFNKQARELSLGESAMLASVPKSPNRINPFGDVERIKARQSYVLDHMVKHNFIDEKSAHKAKDAKLFSLSNSDKTNTNNAPYFLSTVKQYLITQESEEIINKGGLKVYSTLDLSMQKAAEDALSHGLRSFDKQKGYRGPLMRPSREQDKELVQKLENFKASIPTNQVWNLRTYEHPKIASLKNDQIIGARVIRINNQKGTAQLDLGSQLVDMPSSGWSWAKQKSAQKISDILKAGDIVLVKLHDSAQKAWVSLEQDPVINGGIVALDVTTGGVLAMAGGYDYAASPFNRITQTKRQPGSGIKPFLYGLAIDNKKVTAASIITDVPKAFYDPGTDDFWRPRNHTNKFLGDITFRHCLRSSINICSIELLNLVSINSFIGLAKKLNLSSEQSPYPRNLTIALGSAESVPIDVANAMRIFPHGGLYSPYYLFDKYNLASGEEKKHSLVPPEAVIAPGSAYITTSILQEVISETKRDSVLANVTSELAGKTGTTNDARSVWFIGYSPAIIALVFVGYDDNQSLGNAWGSTAAFPIWAEFMNTIGAGQEKLSFKVPSDIEWQYVNAETGKPVRVNDEFLLDSSVIKEVFLAGTAPRLDEDEREDEEDEAVVQQEQDPEVAPRMAPSVHNRTVFAP